MLGSKSSVESLIEINHLVILKLRGKIGYDLSPRRLRWSANRQQEIRSAKRNESKGQSIFRPGK